MIEETTRNELHNRQQNWVVMPNNDSGAGFQPVDRVKRSRRRGRGRLTEAVLDSVRQSVLAGDSLYQTFVKTNVGMNTVVRIRKEVRLAKAPAARCS